MFFRPKKNALFIIELLLDNQGAHYSTNLNSFEAAVVSVFDKAIASTQNVPQLEKVRYPGSQALYADARRKVLQRSASAFSISLSAIC